MYCFLNKKFYCVFSSDVLGYIYLGLENFVLVLSNNYV